MTDNFARYKEFIELAGGLPENNEKGTLDKYYVIELIRRGKDNPDMPAANYHFKNYYIYSWKDYKTFMPEIKQICDLFRLRAYGSVNYKMMSQVALDTISESARRIAAHDYKKFYKIFETCSSKFHERKNNLWILDIDNEDTEKDPFYEDKLIKSMSKCQSNFEYKVVYRMPTKTGTHLITRPFNKHQFKEFLKKDYDLGLPDIKDNHLTLIYENL